MSGAKHHRFGVALQDFLEMFVHQQSHTLNVILKTGMRLTTRRIRVKGDAQVRQDILAGGGASKGDDNPFFIRRDGDKCLGIGELRIEGANFFEPSTRFLQRFRNPADGVHVSHLRHLKAEQHIERSCLVELGGVPVEVHIVDFGELGLFDLDFLKCFLGQYDSGLGLARLVELFLRNRAGVPRDDLDGCAK